MNTTSTEGESLPINPYSTPKSQASLIVGRFMKLLIMCMVVAAFASAGTFVFWQAKAPDVPQEGLQEEPEIAIRRSIPD